MPSRAGHTGALQQQHLRGQPEQQQHPSSFLAHVHDLSAPTENQQSLSIVENANMLDVVQSPTDGQDPTDHLIITSGGRTHFAVNYNGHNGGDRRALQDLSTNATAQTAPPSMAPTEDCYSIGLTFETDGDAEALSFAMYNLQDLDDGVLNNTIIALQNNTAYSPAEPVCVEKPACYRAILFDNEGDGFDTTGALSVTLDDVEVLNVQPGDAGTPCASCEVPGTVYFFAEFGDCVVDEEVATGPPTNVSVPEATCADLDLSFVTDSQEEGYVVVVLESGNFENVLFSQNTFSASTTYMANETNICLAPGGCWEAFVFDNEGDGFEVGSGFIMDVDGTTVLEVVAGNTGTPCLDCDGNNVVFWSSQFGSCDVAASTPEPTIETATEAPVAAPTAEDAVVGITLCMEFALEWMTDSTPDENSLVVFDMADLDDDVIDFPILSAGGTPGAFDPLRTYGGKMDCLDPIKCYALVVYDTGMDGLGEGGSVTAT
ncbi:MAG: hypothetical protein SGARI_001931, partial [Bacillariaceae sp.]